MKAFVLCILPVFGLVVLGTNATLLNVRKGLISGCNLAKDGQFPYQVAIANKNNYLCSGSLIAPDWVLTSAYCLDCAKPENVFVMVGSTSLQETDIERVTKVIKHENYDRWRRNDDIALLKLKNKLELNDAVQTIPLDNSGNETNGDAEAIFAGWTRNYTTRDQLVYSNITIDTYDDCRNALLWNKISKDQLCSIMDCKLNYGCTDNGSPLVSNGKQVGIHSEVRPCRQIHIYTKVSSYYDWIVQHTGIGESDDIKPEEDSASVKPEEHSETNKPEEESETNKPEADSETTKPEEDSKTNKPEEENPQ